MNEESRTAELLTRLAAETHAPPRALAALDRAVSSARADPARSLPRLALSPALPLVAGALVLAILVASTLLPAPAKAGEILARAERAAIDGAAALSSYQGTIKGENWMGADGTRAAQPSTFVQAISFASPNKVRLEVTGTAPNGAAGMQRLVTDGSAGWIYAPDAKVVQQVPPQFVLRSAPFAASTLGAAMESFAQAFEATQLPDETVAGRRAYVLNLVPKQGNPVGGRFGQIRFWIDQETLLQLGAEMSDPSGAVLMRWRFESIALNVAIAPDAFSFTPPADARPGMLVPPEAFRQEREEAWAALARQVPFQLFKPVASIDGLEAVGPGRGDNGVVMLPFRVPNGPVVVLLTQGPASALPAVEAGTAVQLGDVTATYRSADGSQTLDLERAGTRVHIQSPPALPKEALFALAASLVPVPKQ